jgi:hypothetical protein
MQSGVMTPGTAHEVDMATTTGAAGTTGSGVPEVFPTEDVASAGGELEVVMGHPGLESPGDVSLSEAMSMTHFALCQAQDVLQRE